MKKLFTTLALGLAAVSMAWADCPYEINWSSGSSYATSTPIDSDMQVVSLQTIWGTFPEGTTIAVGNDKQVHITGQDVDRTTTLGQATQYDAVTQTVINLPAIKITFQYAPLSISAYGDYTATIPANSFSINGVGNDQFDVTFTVKDTRVFTPIDLDCTATPAPGTYTDLNNFNVDINKYDENGNVKYVSKGVKQGAKGTIAMVGGESKEFDIITRSTSTGSIRYGLKLDSYTIYENGTYIVTWPEGSFLLGDNTSSALYTNKELKYEYIISNGTSMRPNITPAPGTLTALGGIEFEAPGDYLMAIPAGTVFTVTCPNGDVKQLDADVSQNNMYIYLRGQDIFYEPGEYTVEVPKKGITFIDSDSKTLPSIGFKLKYTVTGGSPGDLAYTLTDSEGEITDNIRNTYKLDYFYVTFDKDVTPTQFVRSKVVYPDGSVKYAASTSWSSANKRFMIFMNFPKEYGKYEITFPAAAACADGVFNKDITFTVNYLDQTQEELTCYSTPQSGSTVTELQNMSVSLDPDKYTSASPYLGGITKTYFANDDDQEHPEMQYLHTSGDPLMLSITLDNKITEPGDYTWSIPENSILAVKKDGTQVLNKPINFFWSVRTSDSVAESFSDDVTEFNVYDLNGVCILKNGSREELNSLGKGIYVINGKTFILR